MFQCLQMVGSDDRMDHGAGHGPTLNPAPETCSLCGMRDLDCVVQPYLLRGFTSPADMAPADAGNFLVRQSAKRVLETVTPTDCRFHPTADCKTGAATPWFLAIPAHLETLLEPVKDAERCPQCGEPWCFPFGANVASPMTVYHVFKSRNWQCYATFRGWQQKRPKSLDRDLYFSVRLETLLKKLKMRGLVRSYKCKEVPSPEDLAWVDDQLRLLGSAEPLEGAPTCAPRASDWFADYLKKHAGKKPRRCDFATLEKKHRVKLPESYQQFMIAIGPKTFQDVEGEKGYNVRFLPLAKLDFAFRGGLSTQARRKRTDLRHILFATTEHGDAFCFNVAGKDRDYEVHRYDHEMDDFEPFTKNFAAFIKRLTEV